MKQPESHAPPPLFYDTERRLLICTQHQFALIPKGVISHLRQKHQYKGQELRAVQDYLRSSDTSLFYGPETAHQPTSPSTPIPKIATTTGFACNITACSKGKDWISRNRRAVEKHVSRAHDTPDRRRLVGKEHARQSPNEIVVVTFQSIFPKPHYHPFIVQYALGGTACSAPLDSVQSAVQDAGPELEDYYKTSLAAEEEQLHAVSVDAHKSQIPPWLSSTGIAQWLGGLKRESVLVLLVDPTQEEDKDGLEHIFEAVYEALASIRRACQTGRVGSRLSRVAARSLNSFELDRMQARPFRPVQEDSTLRRYARAWSLALIYLVRVQSLAGLDESLSRLTSLPDELRAEVAAVAEQAERLCMQDNEDEVEVRTQETRLQALVQQLSYTLTRSLSFESPFESQIVRYCALRTLSVNGGWILASTFAPFISGMIHCMQLWIASYSMHVTLEGAGHKALEDCIHRECQQYLVNTTHSPISELSFWRLLCWKVSDDTVLHPVTTINEKLTAVTHLHVHLEFDAFRVALRAVLDEATKMLQQGLMFGLHGVSQYDSMSLLDNPSNLEPGFSFLKDPRNDFRHADGWLFGQLHADPKLRSRFFSRSQQVDEDGRGLKVHATAMRSYLSTNRRFLSLLAVLIYLTAGLPPRREELISITWRNWETARSIYISDGLVGLVTGYHKSQWRVGNRPVARFLPHAVGNLFIQYIVHVTPLLRFVRFSLEQPPTQGFLFTDGGGTPWSPDRVGDCMQQQTIGRLGFSVTTRQWRHIAIAIDRRLLQSVGCRALGIKESFGRRPVREPDDSDSNLDGDPLAEGKDDDLHAVQLDDTASHLQASHTARTGNSVYGNSSSLVFGLTDFLFASLRRVSRRWHEFTGLDAPEHELQSQPQPQPHKRQVSDNAAPSPRVRRLRATSPASTVLVVEPLPPPPPIPTPSTQYSRLEVRAALWTWPAVERALQHIFGLHATMKSDGQRNALQLVLGSPPESLIIMPTGGGKSILYVLPTLLPQAQVTVVITPLVALQQDLMRRCTQWGINFGVYTARSALLPTSAQPSLLLVDAERASGPSFQTLLSELHAAGRLDRIVLDEAHLLLTASHYREQLPALSVLQRFRCPFICLTATLPPVAEREFRSMLCLTHMLEVLRASSDRPNLSYYIQHLSPGLELHATKQDSLVDGTVSACKDALRRYREDASARIICYVRQKQLGSVIAEELSAHFYHATLEHREDVVTTWRLGTRSPIIIATAALGAGIDYPSIRSVIHVDAPAGMLDYAQETGRAGRDGLHADCLVLLARGWSVTWDRGFRTNFLTEDSARMTDYLQSPAASCLRKKLTRYLDGGSGTACNEPVVGEAADLFRSPCGHCMQRNFEDEGSITSSSASSFASQVPMPYSPSPSRAETAGAPARPSDTARGGLVAVARSLPSRAASLDGDEADSGEESGDDSEAEEPADVPLHAESSPRALRAVTAEDAYAIVEKMPRLQALHAASGMQLYVERVIDWSSACIACSFARRKAVHGDHSDCMHNTPQVTALRTSIRFDKYIGCWKCAQPTNICDQRRGTACSRSTLVFSACHVALANDVAAARDILHALGASPPAGPALRQLHADPSVVGWLGRKSLLYRQEVCNAARLTHFWLDRLSSICTQ